MSAMGPLMLDIFLQDTKRVQRGEPTLIFHNIKTYENGVLKDMTRTPQAPQASQAPPKVEPKVEPKQEPEKAEPIKAEPAPQMEGRVATVNRKKQSRGRTILDPLAINDPGQTYKKRLLGG